MGFDVVKVSPQVYAGLSVRRGGRTGCGHKAVARCVHVQTAEKRRSRRGGVKA